MDDKRSRWRGVNGGALAAAAWAAAIWASVSTVDGVTTG